MTTNHENGARGLFSCRVLVTGGAGFIGSHFVRALLERKCRVDVVDNLSLGRKEHLSDLLGRSDFAFHQFDLLETEKLASLLRGIDWVVHLAANSDISHGPDRTDLDFRNGTQATYSTLEAMRIAGCRKLVFSSTSAVYGETEIRPTPEDLGPLFPISHYGASKLSCEAMVTAFSHNSRLRSWVFRFANIVGSRATHGAIFDFVGRLIKDDRQLKVLGNGEQRKSYLHVEDCVSGILKAVEIEETAGPAGDPRRPEVSVFNLASQGVTRVRTIAEMVVEAWSQQTGRRPGLEFGSGDRGWIGDVPYTHLDGRRLARLGWTAQLESDQAVKKAVSEIVAERLHGAAR
jgi:UDP-glucose 4-epimerase